MYSSVVVTIGFIHTASSADGQPGLGVHPEAIPTSCTDELFVLLNDPQSVEAWVVERGALQTTSGDSELFGVYKRESGNPFAVGVAVRAERGYHQIVSDTVNRGGPQWDSIKVWRQQHID